MSENHTISTEADPESFTDEMTQRLIEITGDNSYREIARRTGFHAETVRRYMQGTSKQSVEFVSTVAREFNADDSVLLRGHPVAPSQASLRLTSTTDLIGELTRRLVDMEEHVNALARRIQNAETRANLDAERDAAQRLRATPLRLNTQ